MMVTLITIDYLPVFGYINSKEGCGVTSESMCNNEVRIVHLADFLLRGD